MAVPMAVDQPSMYQQWLADKAALANAKRSIRAANKVRGAHRARRYAFADGSQGWGAYRRRRFMRRRRYGRRMYGRGGYLSDAYNWLKTKIPKGVSSAVGTGIGSFFGNPLLGGQLGQRFADYTGIGAYAPSAQSNDISVPMDQGVPSIHNERASDGAVVIQHKEYIQDIASTGGSFHIAFNESLNPGNSNMFPWLAKIAANFSQYKLEGMIFHFVSTSGALSTTQALGEIIMACNYNVGEPAYTTKQQMLSEVMSVSKVPSIDAELGIECDKSQTVVSQLFVRGDSGVPDGQDARFYDYGKVTIATQGQAEAVNLGELWVTYQVALYKPQLAQLTPSVGFDFEQWGFTGSHTPGASIHGMTVTLALGTGDLYDPSLGLFKRDFSGYVAIIMKGTGITAARNPPITGTATVNSTLVGWDANAAATEGTATVFVTAAAGQTLLIASNGAITTLTSAYLQFNDMPGAV